MEDDGETFTGGKLWGNFNRVQAGNEFRSCHCVGPQNGEPVCPCRMATLVRVPGVGLVQVIVPEASPAPSSDAGGGAEG